jgi:uncharacterized membrane protein YphA (DoxX/SURF4 family)
MIFTVSPQIELIKNGLPPAFGQSQLFLFLVGFLELLIGIAYIATRFVRFASAVMIVELLVLTIAILFTQGFNPRFPVLSLAGEFVLQNLGLIAAGLVLITESRELGEKENAETNTKQKAQGKLD